MSKKIGHSDVDGSEVRLHALINSENYKKALEHLNIAAEKCKSRRDIAAAVNENGLELTDRRKLSTADLAVVHYYRALALHRLNRYNESISSYKLCVDMYLRAGRPLEAAEGLKGLAECYQELGQVDNAVHSWSTARQLYQDCRDTVQEALVCASFAKSCLVTGQTERCQKLIQESNRLCHRVHNKRTRGELQSQLGWLYSKLGLFDKALRCFRNALRLLSNDKPFRASTLQNIGALSNELGLFSEAVEYHLQASVIFGEYILSLRDLVKHCSGQLQLPSPQSKCLCNLGFAHSQLSNQSLAITSYSQALVRAQDSKDNLLIIQAAESLGAVYYSIGQYNDAVQHFNKALLALDTIGLETGLARERLLEKLSCVREASQGGNIEQDNYFDDKLSSRNSELKGSSLACPVPVIAAGSLALGQNTREVYNTVASTEAVDTVNTTQSSMCILL